MTIEFMRPEVDELKPRISVIGVGGAGGNAIANMIRSDVQGVDFIVANTDAQALNHSTAERRIQLGLKITQGLGAGSRPEIGRAAAEETIEQLEKSLEGAHMCFIAAGMGGGTGTGAAPVIAKAARDRGILTVGVVTKPFSFEGNRRMKAADAGIEELQKHVDTLIVIPNQNLFLIANPNTTFKEAFQMADEVLQQGVRGITDLMVMPGLINLDFADVRSVMSEMGKAMMGTGEASGDNRAIEAAEKAIANPLLDGVSMKGAKGVIVSITGGEDMRLMEVDEAANHIRELVDPDANIIWGSAFNNDLEGKIRVSVVATGIEAEPATMAEPAKSFSFNTARGAPARGEGQAPASVTATPAPAAATPQAEPAPVAAASADAPASAGETVDQSGRSEEELLLGSETILTPPVAGNPLPPQSSEPTDADIAASRRWLNEAGQAAPATPAPRAGRDGGTLFERMSNIARGAAKAPGEEEPDPARGRDPLDIPRFLNRQNNQ
ncbi:cell division protein FtsZ [Sphingomonas prati]|uniref:Cell division protein FtsZ n=1 Tax=Sphingomonas prati TaxID=1843237 RepID=A0A7W9BTN8_9SPHN|nr:cell division protein FtsZ [Sphingomonas prati]MBB5729929.1 cell division protein FtsZ [Sphingomonas prati]GGE88428.1 cell division protein FtsZ [Sphingomonas prati]